MQNRLTFVIGMSVYIYGEFVDGCRLGSQWSDSCQLPPHCSSGENCPLRWGKDPCLDG